MKKSGWYIFDKKKLYLDVSFRSEKAAKQEMAAMLEPYPEGHEWRKRLNVQFVDAPANQKRGEPPYGWRSRRDNKHGIQQVQHEGEQQVLRVVTKLRNGGWSSEEIAHSLNGRGLLPRHGSEWSAELVEGLETT